MSRLSNFSLRTCLPFFLAASLLLPACRPFTPPATSRDYPFKARVQKETHGDITVSMAIPSKEETLRLYGTDLYANGMQPVWVEVENHSGDEVALLTSSMDPEYFSPNEAAYKTKNGYSGKAQWDREIFFQRMSLPLNLPANSVGSGFVITHVDKVTKYLTLDILTESGLRRFSLLMDVPAIPGEFPEANFNQLYPPEAIKDLSLEELRTELEKLPCCVPRVKGAPGGDPLNLVAVVGEGEGLLALARSGWRLSEIQKDRTTQSRNAFLAKRPYKYKLRIPLWLMDRPQDIGFNKPREDFEERSQFWVWLTPWRYQGKRIWVGSVTRDIGIRYKVDSPYLYVTHKIDSDVDETREYLFEDLLSTGSVEKVGWVKGVGAASPDQPKLDAMGDHYYTDGLRLVLFLSGEPLDVNDVEVLNWDFPPRREGTEVRPKATRSRRRK